MSAITFRLDPRSGVPSYLQLVHQVEHALQLGYLRLGDQLPRVKDVVQQAAVNPNTVLKAYRQLEQAGCIAGRPGQGTFVVAAPSTTVAADELATLKDRLVTGWLPAAAGLGLDDVGITALFTRALREFREQPATDRTPDRRRTRGKPSGEGAA